MRLTAVRATSSIGDANDRSEWSDDFVDNLAEKREAAINEARKKRQIDGNVHRLEATPWLQFVGWPQHLAGFTREELLLTIRPADDEPAEDGLAPLTIEDSEEAEGLSASLLYANQSLPHDSYAYMSGHVAYSSYQFLLLVTPELSCMRPPSSLHVAGLIDAETLRLE